jgi:hypothetical protein
MKLAFLRAVFWLWFITRGYYLWSKLWRFLLEGKYKDTPLTQYATLGQLESALGAMKWTEDDLKGVFDVISLPEKVEQIYRLSGGDREKAKVGDCDEFAIYAANRIRDLVERRRANLATPYFMSINWLGEKGEFHGHNICAYFDKTENKWGHIGNWFSGQAQLHFFSLDEIAEWFANNHRDGAGTLIAWAVATPDLKLVKIVLG